MNKEEKRSQYDVFIDGTLIGSCVYYSEVFDRIQEYITMMKLDHKDLTIRIKENSHMSYLV